MQPVCTSALQLIWADTVETFHEQVAELAGKKRPLCKRIVQAESGIALQSLHRSGDDRHIFHSGLLQRSAEEANIVRRTAAAAGLGHDDRALMRIVLSGFQLAHHLSDDNQGRVAGIVVDILQSLVNCVLFRRIDDHHIVAACRHRSLQQPEVDRAHLRHQDGVVLPHFLCKRNGLLYRRADGSGGMVLFTDSDGRDQ